MNRFFLRLEGLLKPILAALLAFITIGVFIQVVLRYVFSASFLWGEELSLFCFIWCVYLGTAVCTWRHTHFSFDIFEGKIFGRAASAQRLLVDLCVLIVTAVIAYTGWQFSQMSLGRASPALGITLMIPTIIIPISGALMTLVTLIDVARDIRDLWTGRTPAHRFGSIDPA